MASLKKGIVRISVFVDPKEKKKIIKRAKQERRSISNYCRIRLLMALQEEEKE